MKLFQAIAAPSWVSGFKVEVSRCEGCHRTTTLRNLSARKAGIRMHDAWYCSSPCFTSAVEKEIAILLSGRKRHSDNLLRLPLGMILISRGLLNTEQWREVSALQKDTGAEIGELLVRHCGLTEEQITAARAAQWNCPVFSAPRNVVPTDVQIPSALIAHYSAIPLHYVPATKLVLVGFVERIEYGLLYAIEKIAGCKTRACFVSPSDFKLQMEQREQAEGPLGKQVVCDDILTAAEMAQTLCRYGVDMEADEAVIGRCKEHIWARLKCGGSDVDLLFRAQ